MDFNRLRPELLPDQDLVALGGNLKVSSLLAAYERGIFPWPMPDVTELTWFCPLQRAILKFDQLHVPKSLKKFLQKTPYTCTIDQAFEQVLTKCEKISRPNQNGGQNGTWITPQIKAAYLDFHHAGHAHSIETWQGDQLVGGLYGVEVQGVFAGESMFHLSTNASKAALLYLIDFLKTKGGQWVDIQMMTPHFEALGAEEISRKEYFELLKKTQNMKLNLFGLT